MYLEVDEEVHRKHTNTCKGGGVRDRAAYSTRNVGGRECAVHAHLKQHYKHMKMKQCTRTKNARAMACVCIL